MNSEMVMGLIIMSIVSLIMIIIGICQMRKKDIPVGFYNMVDPPKKEEVTDLVQWNKKHGLIWIVYGICIELGFWLGYFSKIDILEMIFMTGGVVIPLPFMILKHKSLEKEYRRN